MDSAQDNWVGICVDSVIFTLNYKLQVNTRIFGPKGYS